MEGGVESRKWLHSSRARPMTGKPSLKIETAPTGTSIENTEHGVTKVRTTRNAHGPLSTTHVMSNFSIEQIEAFPNLLKSADKTGFLSDN